MFQRSLLVACVLGAVSTAAEARTVKMLTSFYGSEAGSTLSTGRHFNPNDPTVAAHRTLPIGTRLHAYNPATGKSADLVVQDRGPKASTGRDLDVSTAAARKLEFTGKGVTTLVVEIEN